MMLPHRHLPAHSHKGASRWFRDWGNLLILLHGLVLTIYFFWLRLQWGGATYTLLISHGILLAIWFGAAVLSWRASNRAVRPPQADALSYERLISDLHRSEAQLRYQAYRDTLTGLANRTLLMERTAHALEHRSQSDGAPLILLLGLDDFHLLNDSLGHRVGDQMLVTVANRLHTCISPADMIARLGGDEFAILLVNATKADGLQVARRVQDAVAAPFPAGDKELVLQASIGIALATDPQERAEDLLRSAGIAMYAARRQGKGLHQFYEPQVLGGVIKRLDMETELRRAVEGNEFVLHYQPIVETESGALVGFEALIRWLHPARGLLSPADFIPLAEETGLIVPIGRWVLMEACCQMKALHDMHGGARPTVSINLSAQQLHRPGLTDDLAAALSASGLDPRYLILEITEGAMVQSHDHVIALLTELKKLGIRIAIDDFGTGYSGLSYLSYLPVDIIKVDRSFLARSEGSDTAVALLRGIVDLSHQLGLPAVAEGIEHERILSRARQAGCDLAQGYGIARPLPPGELGQMLEQHPA